MEPRSLQIISLNRDMTITLNEEALIWILSRDEIKDKYISVISITGSYREGKSFLLNFLLRYLRIKYVEKKDASDWLTPDHGSLQGFPYSSGSKRHTVGIHMWSEIFIAKLPKGEEVAIILLDTQGSFDNQSSMDDCARIFALSTLISSFQIYNVMRTIKQYDLGHLQCFGGYGTLMSSEESTPFQNLCFLVRDWEFSDDHTYGNSGGVAFLEEFFRTDNSEVKDQVDYIKRLFNKIDCFLMPHPGKKVTLKSFTGNLDEIDENFKKHVQEFVTMLLSPEKLILKTVNGTKLRAEELIDYIKGYADALKDPTLLKVESIFEATVEAQHKGAFSKAFKFYKGIMDMDVLYKPEYCSEDDLYIKHGVKKGKAVNYYINFKKIDNEEIFDKYLVILKEKMDEEYTHYRTINQEKLIQRESEKKDTSRSKQYQQNMLDLLGDRDYDSFDHYEFDYLRAKIGLALYGAPDKNDEYKKEQKEKIKSLFKVIVNENNIFAKWKDRVIISFIYTCTEPLPNEKENRAKRQNYDPKSDFTQYPVFVLRKCKNGQNCCRIFIDHTGRVYNSWEEYLSNNKLPKCEMIYPKNGRYEADSEGNVILESRLSPACDITNDILIGTDIAGAIGGIASGGALLAAAAIPAVAAAPVVIPVAAATAATVGMYNLVRSALTITDRSKRKESLSFLESSEARGAYINMIAGSLGFIGSGALAAYAFIAKGISIEQGLTAAASALGAIKIGGGDVKAAYVSWPETETMKSWIFENEQTLLKLHSIIFFFGHVVMKDFQVKTLKHYQDSLWNNKLRKAFKRLIKETNLRNRGGVQPKSTEVISTFTTIQNKEEVFAALIRSNEILKENNVKFEVQNGEIKLNGITLDMSRFNITDINEVVTFLTPVHDFPDADVQTMRDSLKNSFESFHLNTEIIENLAIYLLKIFTAADSTTKEKIVNAVSQLLSALIEETGDYMGVLETMFPNHEKYFRLFNMVYDFFQKLARQAEEKFFRWLENPENDEFYFFEVLSLDPVRRSREIFNMETRVYFMNTYLTENGLQELLDYFYTWFTHQIYSFEEREQRRLKRVKHSPTTAKKLKCINCKGYFYSRK